MALAKIRTCKDKAKSRKFFIMHARILNEYAKEKEKIADWPTFHCALLKKRTEYLYIINLIQLRIYSDWKLHLFYSNAHAQFFLIITYFTVGSR